jgi:heat shock protein 5
LSSQYKQTTGEDVSKDKVSIAKLKGAVERAKKILSSSLSTTIEIDDFYRGRDFSESLTRSKFEDLNENLFQKSMGPVKQALRDARLTPNDIDDIVLIGGSTRIPRVRKMLKDYFGKVPLTHVNPDEAVAEGATIQGCIMTDCPGAEKLLMMDVNPLTLGIETEGGVMTEIIKRGTSIPTKKVQRFSTTTDNQAIVSIKIYEGERPMTKQNNLLGQFELRGLPPAPRGVPQIDVTFEIDSNGILKVSASDTGTGKVKSLTITGNGRLSKTEVDRMIVEAFDFDVEDTLAREMVEKKKDLQSNAAQLQWALRSARESDTRLSEADLRRWEDVVSDVLNWLQHGDGPVDSTNFDEQMEKLNKVNFEIKASHDPEGQWSHGEL